MKIQIKEAAKIFNLSPESLRFYERERILVPERGGNNKYRYYTASHIKQLSKCVMLRSLGFTVRETRDIMENGTMENIDEILERKQNEMFAEIQRLITINHELSRQRRKLAGISGLLGTFSFKHRPEVVYIISQYGRELMPSAVNNKILSNWMALMPLVRMMVVIPPDDLEKPDVVARYSGYAMDFQTADKSGLFKEGITGLIPSRKCLYTVQSHKLTSARFRMLYNIQKHIEENNYVLDGDIIGFQLFVDNETSIERDSSVGQAYFEYWIPIKDLN